MDNENIVLIGFMGVGKTTVGKLLAERLQREFLDMDEVIEKETGKSIPDIFAEQGEAAFRNIEKEITIRYCRDTKNNILSFGGGAFMQPKIQEASLKHCTVISLELTWEAWLERIDELKEGRPLLQQKSIDDIKALFEERKNIYSQATYRLPTDNRTPEEVTEELIHVMNAGL